MGMTTWEQLANLTTDDVRSQKGTSVSTLKEFRDALAAQGLAFRDER